MNSSLYSKVQSLSVDSTNLLKDMKVLAEHINPELDPELMEITRQVSEMGHSVRMESPHFATLQYMKRVRSTINDLLENTESRHTRINAAASYRSTTYSEVQYAVDALSHSV